MSKPRFVISCPIDSYSGYGARSRDLAKAIIGMNKYKVEILAQRWGDTSWGFIKDHEEDWGFLGNYLAAPDWNKEQPEIWSQVTIPNEFQAVGKYNIGFTAGIEATACKPEWIQGLNRMNLNIVSSNHSRNVFQGMSYEKKNQHTGQVVEVIKAGAPVEVLFEGLNTDVYKSIPKKDNTFELDIKEDFAYLFVGHWMRGDYGHDRKNVGLMIRTFLETFKNKQKRPALILKASTGTSSYVSRERILSKIHSLKKAVGSDKLPSIYLLNGDLSDAEMNMLYSHPKVKAMISLTKGEGFGRPLLEFSVTGKPIIVSNWSGHKDFLTAKNTFFVNGEMENVHESAANQWLIKEGQWFKPNVLEATENISYVFKNYEKALKKSRPQAAYSKKNFSFEKMQETFETLLDNRIPEFPKKMVLQMPKAQEELPKLQRIEDNG